MFLVIQFMSKLTCFLGSHDVNVMNFTVTGQLMFLFSQYPLLTPDDHPLNDCLQLLSCAIISSQLSQNF